MIIPKLDQYEFMAQYAAYVFLLPLLSALLYMLVIILKKQSDTDRFFSNYDTLDKKLIIQKLEYLEQEKQLDLSSLKSRIQGIGQRYIGYFSSAIDNALEKIYFDYFIDHWIPFRKANWGLKVIFFLGIFIGFYMAGYIFYINSDEELSIWVLIAPFILFPFSLVLSFIYIVFLSIFLTLFRFFAPKRGAVVRSCVLFNCMIRAVGPGRTGGGESDVHHALDFLSTY